MDSLFTITEREADAYIEDYNYADRENTIRMIRVAINKVPMQAKISARFINACIKNDSSYKDDISALFCEKCADDLAVISKMFHLWHMGMPNTYNIIPENSDFADFNPSSIIEESAFETMAEKYFISRAGENRFDVFLCSSIISAYSFSTVECIYKLKGFDLQRIIDAVIASETMFGLRIIVEMSKSEQFLDALSRKIGSFVHKKELLSMIFVTHFSSVRNTRDSAAENGDLQYKETFRSMIDEEAKQQCIRIGGKENVMMFFGENADDVEVESAGPETILNIAFESKNDFFEKFLCVSSPTPTHFLSYLEYFKQEFLLNENEQKTFMEMLKAHHANNFAFLEIVIPKLVKFGIIEPRIASGN
ncbi:hypothetical protein ENBRE01_0491 [Enteropsectra breve]|nr:hypothetical protein ENBRE01_0491 [Enteropsectra breve]